MPVQHIGSTPTSILGQINRFIFGEHTPALPQELVEVRQAAAARHPQKAWTGVNLIHKNSASDVRAHLGKTRDAARTLVSANADMFVVRHSYGTREPMRAFLQTMPENNILKLQVAITPSWHAGAPDAWTVTRALNEIEPAKLTALNIGEAIRSSARFAETIETELKPIDQVSQHLYRNIQARLSGDAKVDQKMVKVLVEDLGKTAMGEKFSRENVYQVVVKTPDGKRHEKIFDASGKESEEGKRYDKPYHATLSPEISIDLSEFAGKEVVVEAYPHGSAGVGGYAEARRTIIAVPE